MTKCPLCPKEYQSEKQLERHCNKIHDCSYEDALAKRNSHPVPNFAS